ncbi:phosphotransferase enzyme family protein [Aspergillus sclerotioniger CBS 115572]|uniref:Phosphotransferase enzyme family protein n=1 Tax=Aspergillus sclerotioniger CBS 115572 TaxID=1450535 RepID=A0A317X5P0_9EURO|nr:phosphotransferase enzyme family protein [Aspergillus sclerotioniger CBS 115572]PWY93924.1 phosphotransferase enzyme family protein [Aspergillus sclerotioniger CBS 115572]
MSPQPPTMLRKAISSLQTQGRKSLSATGQRRTHHGQPSHPGWDANNNSYDYTRGRFLSKEAHEMKIRRVRFNMKELAKSAAESIGFTYSQCVRIEQLPDGMSNKAFLFTMQDGTQVVGKVPNPNAGRPHYTTASEVATMDFMRNELSTPVPRVLAWSSKADENPVGAEYIIMEKVEGVQLDSVWPKMDIKKRFELVKTISGYQKAWISRSFTQYGSLYYSSDLENSDGCVIVKEDGYELKEHRFAVGPTTGREFHDDGRIEVDFDRGPWDTVHQYKSAVGFRELACVQNMTRLPRSLLGLYGPSTYTPSRSKEIAALRDYLALLPFFLPTDESISSAYLWHPDLHTENIFVHPERPSEVLGIIDWQSSEVLPLFDHARQPYFLDYDGPPATGLDPPEFPKNYDQLDPTEQRKAQTLYLNVSLATLYRKLTSMTKKRLFKAMEFGQTSSFDMMLFAQNLLIDGEALYRARMLDIEQKWSSLPGVQGSGKEFSLKLSAEEVSTIEKDANGATEGMELMQSVKETLGELWPEKGIVQPDRYDEAKRLLKEVKTELIAQLAHSEVEKKAWEESWPFDD